MTRFAVAAAALAAAAFAFLPATARANESGHLCESFGSWCAGSGTLNLGAGVVEKSAGRSMAFQATGGTYQGFTVGNLVFTGGTDRCADDDTSNNSYVIVSHCSGQSGVSWAEDNSGAHQKYISVYVSGLHGGTQYDLSGPGCATSGCDFRIKVKGASGYLQSFDFKV